MSVAAKRPGTGQLKGLEERWTWRVKPDDSWTVDKIEDALRRYRFSGLGGEGVSALINQLARLEWAVMQWEMKFRAHSTTQLEQLAIVEKRIVPLEKEVRSVLRAMGCMVRFKKRPVDPNRDDRPDPNILQFLPPHARPGYSAKG